ncbi:hypothetical protein FB381_4318 [Nocardioides albertanoniae]|uniref:Uncharacterized protein n=1 Tax=Nocardioides albertanoniae TaxID=1175486 RepID=A0A543ACT2_9ACTN|nr:hypothetical protein FB381_4318 [Nocardioides albertanoniae]
MREATPIHVWVDVTGAWGYHSSPGILLMWQKSHQGEWEGWVMYASTYSTGHGLKAHVTQSWVNAAHIREADSRPPSS